MQRTSTLQAATALTEQQLVEGLTNDAPSAADRLAVLRRLIRSKTSNPFLCQLVDDLTTDEAVFRLRKSRFDNSDIEYVEVSCCHRQAPQQHVL